jgi:hypothetical protein
MGKSSKNSRARFQNFLQHHRAASELFRQERTREEEILTASRKRELEELTLELEAQSDNYEALLTAYVGTVDEVSRLISINRTLEGTSSSALREIKRQQDTRKRVEEENQRLKFSLQCMKGVNRNQQREIEELKSKLEKTEADLDWFQEKYYEG